MKGQSGHLRRLTCLALLWRGRDTANEYRWRVWEVLSADGTHWACHSPRQCVLPRSTRLRLQGALRGHCPPWTLHFMHFPGLSRSGSRALRKGPGPDGLCVLCPSSVRAAQVTKRLVRSALVPGQPCLMHLPGPDHSGSRVHHEGMVTVSRVPFVSSGKLISGCDTPGRC